MKHHGLGGRHLYYLISGFPAFSGIQPASQHPRTLRKILSRTLGGRQRAGQPKWLFTAWNDLVSGAPGGDITARHRATALGRRAEADVL